MSYKENIEPLLQQYSDILCEGVDAISDLKFIISIIKDYESNNTPINYDKDSLLKCFEHISMIYKNNSKYRKELDSIQKNSNNSDSFEVWLGKLQDYINAIPFGKAHQNIATARSFK
jgi:hypothetical protein